MEQKLHTPEGVRDIYNRECETKLTLQRKLGSVLHLYGYQDIQTPTFEFDDVFRKEIGSTSTKELYRFFDRDGNILALRPDILLLSQELRRRCLRGRISRSGFVMWEIPLLIIPAIREGLKKTQMGAELIGLDSVEADAEMIAMVVDGLKKTGLTEFQVNIGHIDFIQSLLEATGLEEEKEEVRELISNRNYFGVEEILDNRSVKENIKEAFRSSGTDGGPEFWNRPPGRTQRRRQAGACKIQQIYRLLDLQAEDHVTFDLSMMGSYGYYTGIIFRAYTYGTGMPLSEAGDMITCLKIWKNTPSIGFAIIVDELMNALNRQKISWRLLTGIFSFTEETRGGRFSCAGLSGKGKNIEMLKREQEDQEKNMRSTGKKRHCQYAVSQR